MKYRFIQKYIAIIFLLASFAGALHHHADLVQHSDCKICTVQSNLANGDTPSDVIYLTELTLLQEVTLGTLPEFQKQKISSLFQARAPPHLS